jgi:hypothetical protein
VIKIDLLTIGSSNKSEKLCVFCKTKRLRIKGNEIQLHRFKSENVEELRKIIDTAQFEKLFPVKTQFFYHNGCRNKFLKTSSQMQSDISENDSNSRKQHKLAFKEICSLIDEKIIRNDEFVSFKMIFQSYQLCVFSALKTRPYIKQHCFMNWNHE